MNLVTPSSAAAGRSDPLGAHSREEARPLIRPSSGRWRAEALTLAAAGLAALFAVWIVLSHALGPQLAPSPGAVGVSMWSDVRSGALPHHLGVTLARVLGTTALALVVGAAAGIWIGLSRHADAFFAPWLVATLTVPRLLLAVAAYLVIGLNETALLAATTFAVAPSVAVALREGIRAVDWKLMDMARVFAVPSLLRWRRIIWPQLLPFTAASARTALSLAWKMVLFAELLGRPSGIGYQIAFYFQTFNMRQILAYGAAAVIVAAVLEAGMRAFEHRLYRWRPFGAA